MRSINAIDLDQFSYHMIDFVSSVRSAFIILDDLVRAWFDLVFCIYSRNRVFQDRDKIRFGVSGDYNFKLFLSCTKYFLGLFALVLCNNDNKKPIFSLSYVGNSPDFYYHASYLNFFYSLNCFTFFIWVYYNTVLCPLYMIGPYG